MSSRKSRRTQHPVPAVSLVPFMAIMVILVPMLIYIFSFHIIRVQRVQAPRRSVCTTGCDQPKQLELTVLVRRARGFEITWQRELMPEKQTLPLIAMVGGEYDYDTLRSRLSALKSELADGEQQTERVNIGADDDVPWEVISHTMDAVSHIPGKTYQPLFPKVVLTVAD